MCILLSEVSVNFFFQKASIKRANTQTSCKNNPDYCSNSKHLGCVIVRLHGPIFAEIFSCRVKILKKHPFATVPRPRKTHKLHVGLALTLCIL